MFDAFSLPYEMIIEVLRRIEILDGYLMKYFRNRFFVQIPFYILFIGVKKAFR